MQHLVHNALPSLDSVNSDDVLPLDLSLGNIVSSDDVLAVFAPYDEDLPLDLSLGNNVNYKSTTSTKSTDESIEDTSPNVGQCETTREELVNIFIYHGQLQ